MASMVVPTYLAEVAPTKVRGRVVGINSLLVTGGQVIAYLIDAAFYNLPHGWRWMVLAGGIPAVFQLVGMIYLDESPRWLVARGRIIRARRVLQRIYPNASARMIDSEIERIALSMEAPRSVKRRTQMPRRLPSAVPRKTALDRPTCRRRWSASLGRLSSSLRARANETTQVKSKLNTLLHDPTHRRALVIACALQFFQQASGFNSLM